MKCLARLKTREFKGIEVIKDEIPIGEVYELLVDTKRVLRLTNPLMGLNECVEAVYAINLRVGTKGYMIFEMFEVLD